MTKRFSNLRQVLNIFLILLLLLLVVFILNSCSLTGSSKNLVQADPPKRGVETNASRRSDGTILINGHPFFPFGFYHISWAAKGTAEQRQSDVEKIGNAGFNIISPDLINDKDVNQFSSFLNSAQRSGVYVLATLPNALIPLFEHQPALLGILIADDAETNTTPDRIKLLDKEVKKLAPNKLTYISLAVALDRPETSYFGISDMVGNQSYPIGNDNIEVVYNVMRSTVKSAFQNKSTPIANLQTFAYKNNPAPNPEELTNMTYQALMAGVKGVVYYAYRANDSDHAVDLNKQPRTWATLKQLAREMQTLSPALLNSMRTEYSNGNDQKPIVVTFNGAGGDYLLALNQSRTASQHLSIPFPNSNGRIKALFGTKAKLSVKNGILNGKLAPLEVAVYQIQTF